MEKRGRKREGKEKMLEEKKRTKVEGLEERSEGERKRESGLCLTW